MYPFGHGNGPSPGLHLYKATNTINADIFMPCVGFEPHELTDLVHRKSKALRAVIVIDGEDSDRPFFSNSVS